MDGAGDMHRGDRRHQADHHRALTGVEAPQVLGTAIEGDARRFGELQPPAGLGRIDGLFGDEPVDGRDGGVLAGGGWDRILHGGFLK